MSEIINLTMNLYLENLAAMNGRCACPEVQHLYSIKGEAAELKKQCDEISEKPDYEKIRLETQYKALVSKFEKKVRRYNRELSRLLLDTNTLSLTALQKGDYAQGRVIQVEEFLKLKENKDLVVTINCGTCGQQIDLT